MEHLILEASGGVQCTLSTKAGLRHEVPPHKEIANLKIKKLQQRRGQSGLQRILGSQFKSSVEAFGAPTQKM